MLENLVSSYSYLILFLGALIQSTSILIIAGFLVQQAKLNLLSTIIIGTIGSFIGHQIYFYIGRYGKNKIIVKKASWKNKSDKINNIIKKYESLSVILLRFIQGLKIISSIFLGTSKIKHYKFTILNLIASLLWVGLITLIGFFFGLAAQAFLGKIEKIEIWIILILIVIGILAWSTKNFRKN